jgi:hypothetical protein
MGLRVKDKNRKCTKSFEKLKRFLHGISASCLGQKFHLARRYNDHFRNTHAMLLANFGRHLTQFARRLNPPFKNFCRFSTSGPFSAVSKTNFDDDSLETLGKIDELHILPMTHIVNIQKFAKYRASF